MANLKISQLTVGNPAQSGDLIPIARSGANFSITPASIIALLTPSGVLSIPGSTSGTATITAPAIAGTTTHAILFSNTIEQTQNGIATTPTDALQLFNTTAASSGTPIQYSPSIHLQGAGWNTLSSASNSADWRIQVQPISTTIGASNFIVQASTNGGAYGTVLTIDNFGDFIISGNFTFTSNAVVTWNLDTAFSRDSAGTIDVGTGAQGSKAGSMNMTNLTASGTIRANTSYNFNGTTGVTQTAEAVGTLATMGGIVTTFTAVSDERLKNWVPWDGGLNEILGIVPIRYRWNEKGQELSGQNGDRDYVGFSAQNAQASIPETIQSITKDGYLSFEDRPIIAALVNAVKELAAEIKILKARK